MATIDVSGFGGSELLRLCLGHPKFDLIHVASGFDCRGHVGRALSRPCREAEASHVIQPFEPDGVRGLDLVFVWPPSGR
jgi:N-acetyl-gamma-glutamylphosphate reductase